MPEWTDHPPRVPEALLQRDRGQRVGRVRGADIPHVGQQRGESGGNPPVT